MSRHALHPLAAGWPSVTSSKLKRPVVKLLTRSSCRLRSRCCAKIEVRPVLEVSPEADQRKLESLLSVSDCSCDPCGQLSEEVPTACSTARACSDPTRKVTRPFCPVYRPDCHVFVFGFFSTWLTKLSPVRSGLSRFLLWGRSGGLRLLLGSKSPLSSWSTQVLGTNPLVSRASMRKSYLGNGKPVQRGTSVLSSSYPHAVKAEGRVSNSEKVVFILQSREAITKEARLK